MPAFRCLTWPRDLSPARRRIAVAPRGPGLPVTPLYRRTILEKFNGGRHDSLPAKHCRILGLKRPTFGASQGTEDRISPLFEDRRSSAADPSFERILNEHNIFSEGYRYREHVPVIQPANTAQLQQRLAAPRTSLSPSRRDHSEYERFKQAISTSVSESKVMSEVVPFFRRQGAGTLISYDQDLVFNNLEPLTDGATVDPKPDMFDGASLGQVHRQVQADLDHLIIPTKHSQAPIVPNYFLECKSSSGVPGEARRQLTYDIAAGSRAMNALQNYKEVSTAPFDGNAYTLGATYHPEGSLRIYAGHMHPGETGPETHVTQLRGLDVTDNEDAYYRGVAAFRNARDIAHEFRNDFIQSSNAKARAAEQQGPAPQYAADEEDTDDVEPNTITQPSRRASSSRTITTQPSSAKARSKRRRPSSPGSNRRARSGTGKRNAGKRP